MKKREFDSPRLHFKVLHMKGFRQIFMYDCGAASAYSAALTFSLPVGKYIPFLKATSCSPRHGFTTEELSSHLDSLGFIISIVEPMKISELRTRLRQNYLVICGVEGDHWVIAYATEDNNILFFDPHRGYRKLLSSDFENIWYDYDSRKVRNDQLGIVIKGLRATLT
jgi:ABC-type bacteriocin/lantibiotic exporter with double-glycine peptidase domain